MSVCSIDLFAGAGGFTIGAQSTGLIDRSIGYERDDDAVATHRSHSLCEQVDLATYGPTLGYEVSQADHLHLHASPPCQSFSAAGKGKGRESIELLGMAVRDILVAGDMAADVAAQVRLLDANTQLVLVPAYWIAILQPDTISFEQVRAVLPLWEAYADVLEAMGYSTWTGLIHSEQHGVPQTRTRAWLTASQHAEVDAPVPTHSKYHTRSPERLDEGVLPWVSMAEALSLTDGAVGFPRRNSAKATQTVTDDPSAHYGAERNRLNDAGEDWTHLRPSTTVCGDPRLSGPGRNDPNVSGSQYGPNARRITVEEALALQGFPADLELHGSKTSQFRQIGNSVNPAVAAAVIRSLLADVKESSSSLTERYWSCDRWGRLDGPDTDDPNCDCSMCERRREDRKKQ